MARNLYIEFVVKDSNTGRTVRLDKLTDTELKLLHSSDIPHYDTKFGREIELCLEERGINPNDWRNWSVLEKERD